jgi:hypothetical protein
MPKDYSAEWETESGLAAEYDLIIDEARFGFDAKYQDGEALLIHWIGRAFEPNGKFDEPLLISTEDGNAVHVMYPVGKDWDTPDDGKTAAKPGKTAFNQRSIYGMIINELRTGETPGGDVVVKRGAPRTAAIWVGVKVHLKSREIVYKGLGSTERLMPVQVYGLDKGASTGSSAASSAPAAGVTGAGDEVAAKRQALLDKARAAKAASTSPNGKPAYVVQLEELAKASPTYEAFFEPALQLEELILDEKLTSEVVDDGPSGFYARNH